MKKQVPCFSKYLPLSVLFLIFLIYFLFGNGWYPASDLVVQGVAPKRGLWLVVRWESGEGFNSYERSHFHLDTVWPGGKPEHFIRMKRLEEKNPISHNSEVRMYSIRVDDREKVPLREILSENTAIDDEGRFKFKKPGSETGFKVFARKHISLDFPTNYHSGIVQIEVNGKSRNFDLYTGNGAIQKKKIDYWILDPEGRFEISIPVPRYPIRTLVIEAKDGNASVQFDKILLKSKNQENVFPPPGQPVQAMVLNHFDQGRKLYFHPMLFFFQCIFAALSTWILWALWNLINQFSGLYDIFMNRKRYIFWSFFGGAILVYFTWLAAFWPGMMSIDSMVIWRFAKFPEVMINIHPAFNEIFFMYLMHIWDHPAVVPVVQIVLTSLIGAHIFFSIYRKGVRLVLLLPFYALFVFSIPVGLYNIVLWKDIPFALLVLFWAYKIADMADKNRKGTLHVGRQERVALLLLYFSLPLFRHNGAIYLMVIPLFMLGLGIISINRLAFFAIPAAAIGIAGLIVFFLGAPMKGKYYLFEKSKTIVKEATGSPLLSSPKQAVDKYFRIFDINRRQGVWDLWHYFLGNYYDYHGLIKPAGWWDAFPYRNPHNRPSDSLYRLGMKIYQLSYKEPWTYLTWNPVHVLFLFLAAIAFFKLFPLSAIFSLFIFIQMVVLLVIVNLNWRYYYFAFLSSFFLFPMMMLDIKNRIKPLNPSPLKV